MVITNRVWPLVFYCLFVVTLYLLNSFNIFIVPSSNLFHGHIIYVPLHVLIEASCGNAYM